MPTGRDPLVATTALFLVLNTAAVVARLYSRLCITRSFGYDDVVLSLSQLGYIIICCLSFTAFHYGYAAEDSIPYSTLQPYYDPAKAKQFYFATQLTIYIDSGLVKIAVALVLLRIAVTKGLRRLLIGSMVIVVVWTIIMTVYTSHLCATKGASNYAGSKTCNVVGYFRTSTNIVIDYFYALLPVYILWNVKMQLMLKLTTIFLLGLGILASASTIVKLVIIIRLNNATGDQVQPLHYQLLLAAEIELGLAIFAASMAAVRPLLVKLNIPGLNKGSTNHSNDMAAPYTEIRRNKRSGSKGNIAANYYIERQIVIDIESHEMTTPKSGERTQYSCREATLAANAAK